MSYSTKYSPVTTHHFWDLSNIKKKKKNLRLLKKLALQSIYHAIVQSSLSKIFVTVT